MDKVNGNGASAGRTIQINPAEAARFTLEFLQRASLMPAERERFALCESLLQAIASGQVTISAAAVGAELPGERAPVDAPPPERA